MNKLTLCLLLVTLCLSCDNENELKNSIFIEDKASKGLPIYSEWGYNTFGVYYDRTPLTSNEVDQPSKFLMRNGSAVFTLTGELHDDNGYSRFVRIEFELPDFTASTYEELVGLHQMSYDLKVQNVVVHFFSDESESNVELLEGGLQFVRAQRLLVDGAPLEVILSGRFEMKLLLDDKPVTLSDGRFDVGIGNDTFFIL